MTKLGLALSGGGISGTTHVGVLCAFEEAGIKVDMIAGTSAGAIVAALYGCGYTTGQMANMMSKISRKWLDYDIAGLLAKLLNRQAAYSGLVKGTRIRDFLTGAVGDTRMGDLRRPVAITSTDIRAAQQVLFTSMPFKTPCEGVELIMEAKVVDAVLASLAIPGFFRPVVLEDRVLVDGGVMDNCPVAAARAMGADRVIAIDLVSVKPLDIPFTSVRKVLERVLSMNLARLSKENTRDADLVLRPEVSMVGVLDFTSGPQCMEFGYEYAQKRIPDVKRLLSRQEDLLTGHIGHMNANATDESAWAQSTIH